MVDDWRSYLLRTDVLENNLKRVSSLAACTCRSSDPTVNNQSMRGNVLSCTTAQEHGSISDVNGLAHLAHGYIVLGDLAKHFLVFGSVALS